jgi:hypothetical protein
MFLESDLLDDKSSSVDCPTTSSLSHRESSSPIKEGILSKFAKLAPVSLTQSHQQFQNESPEQGTTPIKNETSEHHLKKLDPMRPKVRFIINPWDKILYRFGRL